MNTAKLPNGMDPWVLRVVRTKAASLIGTYGFTSADRDDIRQELLLDYIVRFRKFNPAKSSRRTFLHRVVRHRVATLVDARRAACRDYRLCQGSLDSSPGVAWSNPIPIGETEPIANGEDLTGRRARSSWVLMELEVDVSKVIATLPLELAAVAVALKSAGVVEAARRLGLSRATVYRRITQIRELFEMAGLRGYSHTCSQRMMPPITCRVEKDCPDA